MKPTLPHRWLARGICGVVFLAGLLTVPCFAEGKGTIVSISNVAEISLAPGWQVATAGQVGQIERGRDEIAARQNIPLNSRGATTFQAGKSDGTGSISLGATIMAAESSQAEVKQLSKEQIQRIGESYEQSFRGILSKGGCSEIQIQPVSLQDIGGKIALSQTVSYKDPKGIKQSGVRYHIYMRNATVILYQLAPSSASSALRKEAESAIRTARLTEF